jgi:NADH-quinone oxidoreductase subunit M
MGLFCTALPLALASALIAIGGQETDSWQWFSLLGINVEFSLQCFELSLWMVWLTALLSFLAFAYSRSALSFGIREFAVGLLALEGTIIGAFLSSQNLIQFLFFFEAMILPAAVLIAFHGGLKRRRAVLVFSIYTLAGSVPLIFATLYLIIKSGSSNIFDITETLRALPVSVQVSLFIAFSLAFAVKTPLFPLHSWQGISYSEAPYPLSAILSGAMAKVGVFGFAAWVIPIFGSLLNREYNAYLKCNDCLIAIALFSMLYGAALALKQNNVKRLLAFSSLSHLSLAVAGLFCLSTTVNAGVAVMLVGHGLTAGSLFFLGGIAQKWTGSTNIKNFGAFASTNPIYASIFGFVGIAAIAIPGTVGFVGEFLILQGLFNYSYPFFAIIGGIGIILSAAYMLRLMKNVLFGPVPEGRAGIYLSAFEGAAAIPIVALILYFGLHPAPILKSFEPKPGEIFIFESVQQDDAEDFEEFSDEY